MHPIIFILFHKLYLSNFKSIRNVLSVVVNSYRSARAKDVFLIYVQKDLT